VRVLEARGLTKTYQQGAVEVPAVIDVSLSAEAGEAIAIMGPSGSGKTTLLSMLGCILRPSAGTVTIANRPVWSLTERDLPYFRRRWVGFIFQSFNLFAALTAQENVEVVLNLKGIAGDAARQTARQLLTAVGLEHRAGHLPRDLSGGEKQRVSIARAMAGDPPLMLADEPTANLDSKNGQHIIELLVSSTRTKQRALIVVTHDHRIIPYVDQIFNLEDGRMVV
jgi:putative ABC transport system ATP-binding protein